jgi:hypothetical protein
VEHFWVIRGHERSGPYTEAEILRAYRSGELKPADCLWADGVPVPVPVAEAFAHMLGQEPTGEIDLTLVDIDAPSAARAADQSPYRRPLATVGTPLICSATTSDPMHAPRLCLAPTVGPSSPQVGGASMKWGRSEVKTQRKRQPAHGG